MRADDDGAGRGQSARQGADHVAVGITAGGPRLVAGLQAEGVEPLVGEFRGAADAYAGILVARADIGIATAGGDGLDARQFGQRHGQIGLLDPRNHFRDPRVAGNGDFGRNAGRRGRGQGQIQRRGRQGPALEAEETQRFDVGGGRRRPDHEAAAVVVDDAEIRLRGGGAGAPAEFERKDVAARCVVVQDPVVPAAGLQIVGGSHDEDVILAGRVAQLCMDGQGEGSEGAGHVDAGEQRRIGSGAGRRGAGEPDQQRTESGGGMVAEYAE